MARISDEIFFEMEVIFLVNLETTDIFRGALFLCRGAELRRVRFRNNGNRIASFLITGEGLDRLDKQYRNGQALAQSRGIDLKKNGKSYHDLCPFHDDTNPSLSINPTKNLWPCFGCGAAGEVVRFVELIDKVSFPEAANKLKAEGSERNPKQQTTGS
jgi:hypothetical protein